MSDENKTVVNADDSSSSSSFNPLTLELIRDRVSVSSSLSSSSSSSSPSSLLLHSHLHCDRLSLTSIHVLSLFSSLTHLYLHYNQLHDLSPLHHCPLLRFLCVSHNLLSDQFIHTVTHMKQLEFLDASFNQIEDFDPMLLPDHELRIVSFEGNPCCSEPLYRENLIKCLPEMILLDNENIHREEQEEEEEEETNTDADTYTSSSLHSLSSEILSRSSVRSLASEANAFPSIGVKLLSQKEWNSFLSSSVFSGSDHDHRDGFIHLSSVAQLEGTLQKHYDSFSSVVLVLINFSSLSSPEQLKWEQSRDSLFFPHLYSELRMENVVQHWILTKKEKERFSLPTELMKLE